MYLSNETFDEVVFRVKVYLLKLMAMTAVLICNNVYDEVWEEIPTSTC